MPGTIVSLPNGNSGGWSSVVIQVNGKIVVAGGGILERLNTDGTLDSTFGSGGIVTESQVSIAGLALDAAGNIVAAGTSYFSVARFTPAGALDTTFNGTGYARTNIGQVTGNGGGAGSATSVAINPSNGKIAVGGTQFQPNSPNEFAVAQYNTNGSLDTTFNGTGVLTYNAFQNSFNNAARAVACDPTGNIVLAGEDDMSSPSLAKYAVVLIDPPSGAASSTTTTTDSTTNSATSDSSSLSQSADIGIVSSGTTATTLGNGTFSPTASRSGAAWQGGIWSFVPPAMGMDHHLPFESGTGGSAGLWDILDTAFAHDPLPFGL
jgi:uncharacterized delta-60 repeat protein